MGIIRGLLGDTKQIYQAKRASKHPVVLNPKP